MPSLLARAELHRQRGEVDEAAELMRRAAMHGAVSGEERARIFSRYYGVYHEAGRLAEAYLRMAQTYAASGYFRNAATLLRRAGDAPGKCFAQTAQAPSA